MARITKKTFREALKNSGGNQSRIAERMEVTRQAVGEFLKKNPDMRIELEDEAERLIDVAEDNIATAIMIHGDIDASKWIATNSKRGKARGWGQKQEIEHSGDREIIFQEVIMSDEEIRSMKAENIRKMQNVNKSTSKPKAK